MNERDRATGWWIAFLLLAVTGLGFWFRWRYAWAVSFFVDEYLTVRAAERILAQGFPLLPSGNFYSHGLLLSYIEAVVIGLGGSAAWLQRLPVVLMSTAAIPLTYWLGRRAFSPLAGLVAAALLAVAPEAILWGGRVRMYAPLQFFVLLVTIVFYLWVVEARDRPAYPALFVLAYWGALFSHAEAMLLLPVLGVWALVQRGWRWCLRPAHVAAFALSGVAVVVEILLRRIGPPVQARVAAGVLEPIARQYLGAGIDWPGVQKVLEPLFLTPSRLPLVVLLAAGLGYLLLVWALKADAGQAGERRALAYLYAILLSILFMLLFVMDPEWKSPRYAVMLLPHLFLIAGALLARLGRWLQGQIEGRWAVWAPRPVRWAGMAVAVGLIVAAAWAPALAATRESVPAYDRAFAYVEEHQQPGDAVITFLCPAAFVHLGQCDYLAIPKDFSGFAVQVDGRWVSGWDEVPILDSGAGLREALASAPGAWFVIDEGRFGQRYEDDFVQAVWDEMDLAAAEQEMLIFRSKQGGAYAAAEFQARPVRFEDGIGLAGYGLDPANPAPGDELALTLYWQAHARPAGAYTAFVHLVDEAGQMWSQADAPPLGGLYPTWRWRPGPVLPDARTLPLPSDLPAGRYRLEVGLYHTASLERLPLLDGGSDRAVLDYVWIGERPALPIPQHEAEATFGEAIRLLGYDLSPGPETELAPGSELAVTLYWEAVDQVGQDYTVFVHLVDEAGQIQGQGDGPPLGGGYPTSFWKRGDVVGDRHTLMVDPEAPGGEFRLLVGLYMPADGARLAVTGGPQAGQDHMVVVTLQIR